MDLLVPTSADIRNRDAEHFPATADMSGVHHLLVFAASIAAALEMPQEVFLDIARAAHEHSVVEYARYSSEDSG